VRKPSSGFTKEKRNDVHYWATGERKERLASLQILDSARPERETREASASAVSKAL